jgi:uncharacterized membrane protein
MRLAYLDAARGVALVLMVVNHTARYWIGDDLARWPLIYLTTSAAGPAFLFLVGFVLPLSYRASPHPMRRAMERAAMLFAAGYVVNAVLWPQQPLLGSNVLHTIGMAVLVAPLTRPWLDRPLGRYALGAAGAALYVSFVWLFVPLTGWIGAHPLVAQLAFYDFPPWPWLGLVLLGLALGAGAAELRGAAAQARFYARLGWAAAGLAAGALLAEWWWSVSPRLTFAYDLLLTNHWIPRGASVAWVLAWSFATIAACFHLVERVGLSLQPLVVLGRTALFLYVAHHVIVVSMGQRMVGLSLRSWPLYWLATALLLAALVALGAGWSALRRGRRPEDVGGPDMAPHTPQRSAPRGKAVAGLDNPVGARSVH